MNYGANQQDYERYANDERYKAYLKSDKWKQIAKKRMEIDGYTCQGCECKGTATNPLEIHHLSYRYIYHEESRIFEDLVSLCHSCHKTIHKVMERKTNAQGRRGWKDNPRIPTVSTFTITGEILNRRI